MTNPIETPQISTQEALDKAADTLLDKDTIDKIGRRQGVEGIVTYLLVVVVVMILLALVGIIITLIVVNAAQSHEIAAQTDVIEVSNKHLAEIEKAVKKDLAIEFGKRFTAVDERDREQLQKMAEGIKSATKERADLQASLDRIEKRMGAGR